MDTLRHFRSSVLNLLERGWVASDSEPIGVATIMDAGYQL